ncbi:hypothetical protein RRG08_035992 [Elysia crispata]|uniref:Uncharacterized protein n=1 Tax=Elysia crispata TaxID=231223 RepID=A0AAE1AT31_9GAST|nr:hypothetical protein RRG08_035992 [Elysia crispata]
MAEAADDKGEVESAGQIGIIQSPKPSSASQHVTARLVLAIVGATMGSFQFGYNLGVINAPESGKLPNRTGEKPFQIVWEKNPSKSYGRKTPSKSYGRKNLPNRLAVRGSSHEQGFSSCQPCRAWPEFDRRAVQVRGFRSVIHLFWARVVSSLVLQLLRCFVGLRHRLMDFGSPVTFCSC